MPDEPEVPEFAPGTDYEPARPPSAGLELPGAPPAPSEEAAVTLSPKQFRSIQTPMIHDPEDKVGARCFDPGPDVEAQGKMVNLACVRKRGHSGTHRSMQGEHPESRVFHEWE